MKDAKADTELVVVEFECFAFVLRKLESIFRHKCLKTAELHKAAWHSTDIMGVEYDGYTNQGIVDGQLVCMEISFSYLDPHFLLFQLWVSQDGQRWIASKDFQRDQSFSIYAIGEAQLRGIKFGEIFVRPCQVKYTFEREIITSLLLPPELLSKMHKDILRVPSHRLGDCIAKRSWAEAAQIMDELISTCSAQFDDGPGYPLLFMSSLAEIFRYKSGNGLSAAINLVRLADGYLEAGLPHYALMSTYHAAEALAQESNIKVTRSEFSAALDRSALVIDTMKPELIESLMCYVAGSYVATAVMCRRMIELEITRRIEIQTGHHIKSALRKAKEDGQISRRKGGLRSLLELANSTGLLTTDAYRVAEEVRRFGNNIHAVGRIENKVDAMLALQACLHVIINLSHDALFKESELKVRNTVEHILGIVEIDHPGFAQKTREIFG